MKLLIFFIAGLLILTVYSKTASSNDKLLIETIAYEASDQPIAGQKAVAEVLLNAMHHFNRSIEKEVFYPYRYSCWNHKTKKPTQSRKLTKRELFNAACALNLAKESPRTNMLYYMRHDIKKPFWLTQGLENGRLYEANRIGEHVFYADNNYKNEV